MILEIWQANNHQISFDSDDEDDDIFNQFSMAVTRGPIAELSYDSDNYVNMEFRHLKKWNKIHNFEAELLQFERLYINGDRSIYSENDFECLYRNFWYLYENFKSKLTGLFVHAIRWKTTKPVKYAPEK